MHLFLRRAALFLIPLLVLSLLLLVFDHWFSFHRTLKARPATVEPKPQYVLKEKKIIKKERSITIKRTDQKESFPVVVVDPAHGGDDIGNVGYKSAVESSLDLQFAFKLARALRMKGIKVYLTRMDDKAISPEQRAESAKARNTALYLSINCAYSDIKTLKGMEMFGFTPVRSEEDELANNTNKFYDAYEGVYVAKTPEAIIVENKVYSSFKDKSSLERKFLKPLALPSGIPALLLYIGYISNEDDVRALSDDKYVDKTTERIAIAVEKGLTKKAP